ncbi:MAG: tetratricopeptide repeat protein [Bdellovibrio sp.]
MLNNFRSLMICTGILLSLYLMWERREFHYKVKLSDALTSSPVTIYSNHSILSEIAQESLALKKIDARLVEMDHPDDIHRLGLDEQLRKDGIMNSDGDLNVPFYKVGEHFYTDVAVRAALEKISASALEDRKDHSIIVYGPLDCPKTEYRTNLLTKNKIPFEYRDVNNSKHQGKYLALMNTLLPKGGDWPIVVVNGKILAAPSYEEIVNEYTLAPSNPIGEVRTSQSIDTVPLNKVAPEKMLENRRALFRLKPDERVRQAATKIVNWLTAKSPVTSVDFKYVNEKWEFYFNQKKIGTISELATFGEQYEFLKSLTQSMMKEYPLSFVNNETKIQDIENGVRSFDSSWLIETVNNVDNLWRMHQFSKKHMILLSESLVNLSMQSADVAGVADPLYASALAATVMADAVTENSVYREKVKLACILEYKTESRKLAEKLSEQDPLKDYILENWNALKIKASTRNGSTESQFYWLLSLANRDKFDEWDNYIRTLKKHDPLPLSFAGTLLTFSRFELFSPSSALVLNSLLNELSSQSEHGKRKLIPEKYLFQSLYAIVIACRLLKLSDWADFLEDRYFSFKANVSRIFSSIEKIKNNAQGPFSQADWLDAFYSSYAYSSLTILGLGYKNKLSSIGAMTSLATEISRVSRYENKDNKSLEDYSKWFTAITEATSSQASQNNLFIGFSSDSHLSASLLKYSFKEVANTVQVAAPEIADAGIRLARKMDARPSHRLMLREIAQQSLFDPLLEQKLYLSTITEDSPLEDRIWELVLSRNKNGLLRVVSDPKVSTWGRMNAANFLRNIDGITDAEIISAFNTIIESDPTDFQVREIFAKFLIEKNYYEDARSVIKKWLDINDPNRAMLSYEQAHSIIANAFLHQGLFDKAWEELSPHISSYKGSVLIFAAMALAGKNKFGEAVDLGKKAVERYPGAGYIRAGLAWIYWRAQHYTEAAELFVGDKFLLGENDWDESIAPFFCWAFEKNKTGDIKAALNLLITKNIPSVYLMHIADNYRHIGNKEAAFEVYASLSKTKGSRPGFFISAFSLLRSIKNEQEALSWLNNSVSEKFRIYLAMAAFDAGEDGLLWNFIQNPQGTYSEYIWAVRAASLLKNPNYNHQQEINKFFEKKDTYYSRLAKYFAGSISPEELIKRIDNNNSQKTEIAYFIGYKNELDGKLKEAVDWYWISHMVALQEKGESQWSLNKLYAWSMGGKKVYSQTDLERVPSSDSNSPKTPF